MHMRLILAMLAGFVAGGTASAADAVFSAKGDRIYTINTSEASALRELDLAKKTATDLPLAKLVGETSVVALSRSQAGHLLCATKRAIWAYDPAKRTSAKVCEAPPGNEILDVAYDPKTMSLVFPTRFEEKRDAAAQWKFFVLKKGASQPVEVVMRRIRALVAPMFDDAGDLYFGAGGDLWQGSIEWEKDVAAPPALVADRCAPLATLETANTTPSQMGVAHIAVAGDWLYAHVYRMGGSGWGTIARVKKPGAIVLAKQPEPAAAESEKSSGLSGSGLRDRVKIYLATLGSLEVLADNGGMSFLCAAADGSRVFFTCNDPETPTRLVTSNGKPEKFSFVEELSR